MEIKISTSGSTTQITNKRELVPANDPILKQITPEFSFSNPPINPIQLANEMIEALNTFKGIGLACPQIGFPYRMFVMGSGNQIVALFNPVILKASDETELLGEGCLTFPGLFIKIRRAKKIDVSYRDYNGKTHEAHFIGLTSRIFQHETDHLNGKLFTDVAGKMALQIAKKKFAKEQGKK